MTLVEYYTLKIGKITRKLPIVSISPKIKIASFNLLGDCELVESLAKQLKVKLINIKFDYLVGPEVKVVPLLQELSKLLKRKRYIICRKNIHGYMTSPIKSRSEPRLIIDGADAEILKNKKVVILDDVVTSGKTLSVVEELIKICGATVSAKIAVFKQDGQNPLPKDLVYLYTLPIFPS